MPLPQQVVEQLGQTPEPSHRVAGGALWFAGGLLLFVALLYAGISFVYTPYVNGQISSLQNSVAQENASISNGQEQQLIGFYSQITNLRQILANHVYATKFLSWLESHTEANVYYQGLTLSSGYKVTLKGVAKTEADVNQQLAIFESAPDVVSSNVSNVAPVSQTGGVLRSGFAFNVTLTMKPSTFLSSPITATGASTAAGTGTTATNAPAAVTATTTTSTTATASSSSK